MSQYQTYVQNPCPVNILNSAGEVVESGDQRTQCSLKANAQALMTLLIPVLTGTGGPHTGATLVLVQGFGNDQNSAQTQSDAVTWQFEPGEDRRCWEIWATGVSGVPDEVVCGNVELAISGMWAGGVGAPGTWQEVRYLPGTEPADMKHLAWVPGAPVATTAPQVASLQLALSNAMAALVAKG